MVTVYQTEEATPAEKAAETSSSFSAAVTTVQEKKQEQKENKIIPVEALETLWVPGLCGNQPANLVGGKLPAAAKTVSNQAGIKHKQDGTPLGAYTDMHGDGRDEAVIAYNCDGGGAVGWPDTAHLR